MTEQTTRWWGRSWGAPICIPTHCIAVPVGERCRCGAIIDATMQGVTLPFVADVGAPLQWLHWELDCWLEELGIGRNRMRPNPVFTMQVCAACSERIHWRPGEKRCQISVRMASALFERCRNCLGNFEDRVGVQEIELVGPPTLWPDHVHASNEAFDSIGGPQMAHRCACGIWGLSDGEGKGIRWEREG